ncbi:unnamed protein product [Ceutorhynchus assimilis]|uniref:Uncharacterized protein n=1 Tax=Ceutorhynchus assimilis TaxID=467358 RepID=A0A9N9MBL2_9CUCU|nr:unnamed protein product [Ceutorhynchus assimilis]
MNKLHWIKNLEKEDVQSLISTVEIFLLDIDGVLLRDKTVLPGSDKAVAKLRSLGKKIGFVTNNSFYPMEVILKNLKPFEALEEEILTPNFTFLGYLKKIDFKKDIYMIACNYPKKLLREAGYNVIDYQDINPSSLGETASAISKLSFDALDICKNVGIVYLDFDANCQYGSLQVAKILLNYLDDVNFVIGPADNRFPIENKMYGIGNQYLVDALLDCTNKTPIRMGKPSQAAVDLAISKFEITDPSRTLMVGDNAEIDIVFGARGGFKTLLTLSGVWTKEQVEDWKSSEESKPDYIAFNMGELYELIKDM